MNSMNTLRSAVLLLVLLVLAGAATGADRAADQEAKAKMDEARAALNAERYREAAALYAEVRELADARAATGDALYWEAFARYRLQQTGELKHALALLQQQQLEHQAAATAAEGEALAARISGELAARGEAKAAQDIYRMADEQERRDATRIAALHALMQVNPEKARPMLKQIITGETEASAELRQNAVFILCREDAVGTDIVIEALPQTTDPEILQAMAMCLAQDESDRSLEALMALMQRSDDVDVQQAVLLAIGRRDSPRAHDLLADLAMDRGKDAEMRAYALLGLSQSDDPRTVRIALDIVNAPGESDEVLEMAFMALANSETAEAEAALMTVAENPAADQDLRAMALFNAGRQGKLDVDRLRRIYDSTDSRDLKMQVCHVLSQMKNEPRALDLMLDIIRQEEDQEIRETAVFWIGQFDDPRAADALVEIISGQ